MKIYKYKDLTEINATRLNYLYEIILQNKIWCARPDSLNDKDEFIFKCDYTPSVSTHSILSQLLVKFNNTSIELANLQALFAIERNRLEDIATPIIDNLINDCRNTIGVCCFSISKDDNKLWNRYGGDGNGLCIEIDVHDELLNKSLFYVNYVTEKIFHIDSMIESALFQEKGFESYRNVLLTKTKDWEPEKEIRIITKLQNVNMPINGSITEIIFGKKILPDLRREIKAKISEHFLTHFITFTE